MLCLTGVSRRAAFFCTLILLGDAGVLHGKLIWVQFELLGAFITGGIDLIMQTALTIHSGWRIITPGLSIFTFLFYLAFIYKIQDTPSRRNHIIAGFLTGLLFYTYFYYWTTAGLALALCLIFCREQRRSYFLIGASGLALGLPAIVSSWLLKQQASADWLSRTDKFIAIDHLSELQIPKVASVIMMVLGYLIWRRHRPLFVLWLHALAGMLLMNHQILTGLQIENFHWRYCWGPVVSALTLAVLYREVFRLARRRLLRLFFASLAVFVFGSGLFLRYYEAENLAHSTEIMHSYADYTALAPLLSRLPQNAVMAAPPRLQRFVGLVNNQRPLVHYFTLISAHMDNDEISERHALAAVLTGESEASFAKRQRRMIESSHWDRFARDKKLAEELIQQRLRIYRSVSESPLPFVEKYQVESIVSNGPVSIAGFKNIGTVAEWNVAVRADQKP